MVTKSATGCIVSQAMLHFLQVHQQLCLPFTFKETSIFSFFIKIQVIFYYILYLCLPRKGNGREVYVYIIKKLGHRFKENTELTIKYHVSTIFYLNPFILFIREIYDRHLTGREQHGG